jgi:hypothetical protein
VSSVTSAQQPVEPGRLGAWGRLGGGMALALLVLVVVGFFRGPASTLDALREAARNRDAAELARRIDGPALRHSLGRLLLQQTGAALPEDGGNDRKLMSQFIIAGALVKPLVETLVTPEGIAALLQGHIGPRPLSDAPRPRTDLTWSGLSTVRATVMGAAGDPSLILVMRRNGLSWQLAGVEAVDEASVKLKPAPPSGARRPDGN